ncbi:MAG: leader peptide processing enzyme [Treponema sp.]|nr:leader peptide processing enzyme [Treponema sp.]
MNKKVNTILFVLGATLFNIIITVAAFLLLLIGCAKFILPVLPEGLQGWFFPVIFIASIAVAFVVYRFILRLLLKKIDVEKYFDPLFFNKHKKN